MSDIRPVRQLASDFLDSSYKQWGTDEEGVFNILEEVRKRGVEDKFEETIYEYLAKDWSVLKESDRNAIRKNSVEWVLRTELSGRDLKKGQQLFGLWEPTSLTDWTVGGKGVAEATNRTALKKLYTLKTVSHLHNGDTDFSQEELGALIDFGEPQANTLNSHDLWSAVGSLEPAEYLSLVRLYHYQFPTGNKKINSSLLSSGDHLAKMTNPEVQFKQPYADDPSSIYLYTGEEAHFSSSAFASGIRRVAIHDIVTCVGVFVYNPKTKEAYAVHLNPNLYDFKKFQGLESHLDTFKKETSDVNLPQGHLIFKGAQDFGTDRTALRAKELLDSAGIAIQVHEPDRSWISFTAVLFLENGSVDLNPD